MRGSMAVAACVAALGLSLGYAVIPPCSAAPPDQADAAPDQGAAAEPLPSDTVLQAISAYESAVESAGQKLPKSLSTAPGTSFFVAHAEAIADIDAPAAKTFARRLADVLVAHKIKISDALAKLPDVPPDAAAQPPLSAADNARLVAIVNDLLDSENYPFEDSQTALPYVPLFNSLVETCALYAPAAGARFKATVTFSDTESVFNVGIEPDEDLSQTWVNPSRVAKAWDNTFSYMLDPAHGDSKGRLDPAVGSLLGEFNNEIYALFMISHELSAATPGAEALNGPLDNLIDEAKKAQPAITDAADQELLTRLIAHVERLKQEGAGARAASYLARPTVTKLITDFVAAVNTNDRDALAKLLTPGGAKGAEACPDLASALFNKMPIKDVKVFFVAPPDSDPTINTDQNTRYRLVFYLQATDPKDSRRHYVRLESTVAKSGDIWLLHEINGVFAAE